MKNQPLKFVYFPPSAWSERTKWALDHSGINYDTIVYTPIISTAQVRWITRNFTNKLTAPAAVDGNTILRDSYDIAKYSNARRLDHRQNLFPENLEKEIEQWNSLSEELLNIVRIRTLPRMKSSRDFLLENLPPFIPNAVKPFFTPLAHFALHSLEKKYPLPGSGHAATLYKGLEKLRTALQQYGNDYILGQFSYADITMAVVFQFIHPVSHQYVPLNDANRESYKDPELSAEFSDLIEWRDRLYQKHRF